MNKLDEIIAYKHQEIEPLLLQEEKLKAAAFLRDDFKGFRSALNRGSRFLGVIAEIKKASPSAGVIDPNFDALKQANIYEQAGANCLSILTDEKYFQGHLNYVAQAAKEVTTPILRKDFIVHRAQLYEAVIAGADAVLLIVAGLEEAKLYDLYQEAIDLQLDVLVETHDLREMDIALDLGADLIGINNRNLKTFTTDLATTEELAEEVPDDVLLVSESGIKTTADAKRVLEAGANAVLVGESLMRENDPSVLIESFLDLELETKELNEEDFESSDKFSEFADFADFEEDSDNLNYGYDNDDDYN